MNRIYKVIWNKTRGMYMVVSELAKGQSKDGRRAVGRKKVAQTAAALAVFFSIVSMGGTSFAADTTTVTDTEGKTQTVYTKDGVDSGIESLQEGIQKFSEQVQESLQKSQESIDEEAKKRKFSVTNLENADTAETAAREAADTEIKQAMTDQKTSTALHVTQAGNLIVGTKENQIVKNLKINGQLTAGSLSTGDIVSSGDVTVTGKMAADGVTDETTKDGTYIKQNNTVGNNLVSLDTQVKSNADAIEEEARKRKYSVTNLENADKQLQTNIDNEAATREAKDNELNERITNEANAIHETTNQLQSDLNTETAARKAADAALDSRTTALEDKTEAITYDKDSKTVMVDGKLTATEGITDGTTQDGQYVKADNYVGQNLNALDQGLQAETTARQAADTTLQTNIDNEAAERKAADTVLDDKITAETSARVAADTKLVEAVNSGLSLSDDNVLQKNTTTIDAQGNVTTSKTDANEMILNKGKDNQITLNENGIKVGTNSSVMDANGVYTGGDTYSEAKAAMSADGSIKGADGKFTVNSANGTVNVNDQIELNGATGVVKSNGLNVGDGNFKVNSSGGVTAAGGKTTLASDGSIKAADGKFTVNSNGGVKAADGKITLSSDGSVKAADGKFTVNSDGGVKAADGKITLSSDGSLKAADGKFTVDSNGAVKAANGNTTIDSNGNLSTMGTVSAANGKFTVDTNGAITSTGLDAGNGTIQTTGTVKAGDVQTGTLETTGDATIGGNLTVDKNLTVNGEFNAKTLSSKLDENNYTTITGGKTQSVNLKMDTATGETKASASTFDETGSNLWAKDDDSIGKSTVTADGISQKLSDTGDNPTAYAESAMSQGTDNKYTMTDTVKDGDKTNVASQSATESSDVITEGSGDSAKTSTFRQKIDQILQEIKSANGSTSVEQTDVNITNTAKNGTITNEAQTLVNKATGDMTNTVGGKMLNDVTGDMENKVGGNLTTTVGGEMKTTVTGKTTENYNGGLETTITGEEKHTVNGDQINNITGDQTNTIGGSQTTTVTGDSSLSAQNITNTASETLSNSAKNITNTAAEKLSNSAAEIENTASKSITDKVGDNVSRTMTTSQIKESVVDGANSNTSTKTASKDMNIVTDGTSTSTLSQLAGSVNTSLKEVDSSGNSVKSLNNVQTVSEDTTKITDTATGDFSSRSQKANGFTSQVKNNSGGSNTVTDTATTSEQKLVSGNIIDILKDAETGYVNTTVSSGTGDDATSTSVKQGTADITNTAKQGTITNEAKNLVNKAEEKLSNSAAEIENTATTSIKDVVGKSTVTTTDTGTTFENTDHAAAIGEGSITQTTISGNTLETGKATADYVDVNKDLHVMGNTQLDGTLEVGGKSTFKDDVTMEKNLDVKGTTTTDKLVVNNGANITGGTTTDTLHVTSTATFDGMVTFKDAVSMEKDLTVGGSATVAGDVTAKSYKVGDKTYIDENGINANGQKITNVADGTVAEGSTDAVNGGQLNATNQRVTTVENRMDGVENRMDRVENRVDNLDNRIDKVGASAAAMANLHPMDFDEDSKVSVAAAMGSYRSETAGALGVFYRPTDRVMLNVSTSFGNGENMVGGGVSFKLGKSSKRLEKAEATNATLAKQVTNLQNRLDALLGVLNPSLSKDFPDVPANHWAYEAVSRLAGNNIVQGYEDGKYHGERTMTRYEMAEIIYNALSKGAKAEAKLVEEFRPELQAMDAQRKA